jgi:small subunit ribosomal protein S18
MKDLESGQKPIEEKTEGNSISLEEEVRKEKIAPKPNKKTSFKPRKIKKTPARIAKKDNYFVRNNITYIDYKNTKLLNIFVNKQGQIVPKILSKLPSNIQREVAKNIKRARQMKLMPYTFVDQGSF